MEFSVVVPTLNGRQRLGRSLDALEGVTAEVVVVNGPSTDGTSGLVREHPAVDLLVEVAERNLNVARNAGIAQAGGRAVAFFGDGTVPEGEWFEGAAGALVDGAAAVTGPVHRSVAGGVTTEPEESRRVAGRTVTFFDGGNVAFTRSALEALDGFDEYLAVGGARDAAHRLAGMGYGVAWHPRTSVLREAERDRAAEFADTGHSDGPAWGRRHRSLAYRLTKNYGLRPSVAAAVGRRALGDAASTLGDVLRGDGPVSVWLGNGGTVLRSAVGGAQDGLSARRADGTARRNPNGVSARSDRVIARVEL
jgi:glycosyltransferase involved in cell wall biosynthesis